MLPLFLLTFPIYFLKCKGLTETKHMSGGVFGWADSLKSQRNLWGGTNFFNKLKLYKSEPNVAEIVERKFLGDIDYNLTQKINEVMDNLKDNFKNEENDNKEKSAIKIKTFKLSSILRDIQKIILKPDPKIDGDDEEEEEPPSPPPSYDDQSCSSYPNVDTFGKLFTDQDCEYNDKIIGELFSYLLIFAPIAIIGLLAFIFYIVFAFGCCCCCKPQDRTCPGIVSIVFFGVIAAFMLISICFHIAGSVYLLNIINYFTSDSFFDEVEEIADLIEPTINNAISDISTDVINNVEIMSDKMSNILKDLVPELNSGVKSTISNVSSFEKLFEELNGYTSSQKNSIEKSEKLFNSNCPRNDGGDPIKFTDQMDFKQFSTILNDLKKQLEELDVSDELSSFTGELGGMFNDTFSGFTDSLDFKNVSLVDMGDLGDLKNIREKFDLDEYIPSWVLLVLKILLFVVSILMFVILALQSLAFWTKNCCSRCIVGACFPCCCCSCFQTICGAITTAAAGILLIINILYYQGDEVFDRVLKRVLNDEKVISLGSIDLQDYSEGLISKIEFEEIKIKDIKIVKSLIDAKLDSSFADILDFEHFPLRQISDCLNRSFANAAKNNVNVSSITAPVNEALGYITDEILGDFDMNNAMNVPELRSKLNNIIKELSEHPDAFECQDPKEQFEELSNLYDDFFNGFVTETGKFNTAKTEYEESTGKLSVNIGNTVQDVITSFLTSFGSMTSGIIGLIESIFGDVDAKFLVALFNVIRVRIFYQIIAYSMCVSISAHFFIISMWAMTILLWIRRKGMARTARDSQSVYSYSYSENEDSDKKSRRKKRGKDLSDDENTSDGRDIELVAIGDRGGDDEMNSSQKVSEKEGSESNNPYKHDSPADLSENVFVDTYMNNQREEPKEDNDDEDPEQSFSKDNDQNEPNETEFKFNDSNNENDEQHSSVDESNNNDDEDNYIF